MAALLGGTATYSAVEPGINNEVFNENPDDPAAEQRRFNFFDYAADGQLNGSVTINEYKMLGRILLPSPDAYAITDRQRASANGFLLNPTAQRNFVALQHTLPTFQWVSKPRRSRSTATSRRPSSASTRTRRPERTFPLYTLFDAVGDHVRRSSSTTKTVVSASKSANDRRREHHGRLVIGRACQVHRHQATTSTEHDIDGNDHDHSHAGTTDAPTATSTTTTSYDRRDHDHRIEHGARRRRQSIRRTGVDRCQHRSPAAQNSIDRRATSTSSSTTSGTSVEPYPTARHSPTADSDPPREAAPSVTTGRPQSAADWGRPARCADRRRARHEAADDRDDARGTAPCNGEIEHRDRPRSASPGVASAAVS